MTQRRKTPPAHIRQSPAPAVESLIRLVDETRLLFHRLRATAAALHSTGQLTAGLRGILVGLAEGGPRSVPEMARARPTSRQHIQSLVNRLLEVGLVVTSPNPAHRRSPLIALTQRGVAAVREIRAREAEFLDQLPLPLSEREVRGATRVLRELRESLAEAELRDRTRSGGESEDPS